MGCGIIIEINKSEFVVIIMLFKEINKRDFDKLALKMFSILSSNMEIINPKEIILDDNFLIWLKYQKEHFREKVFIIFEDGDTLVGYFQYSFIDDNLLIEEIEIMPSYQVRFGVLSGLFRFMRYRIPDNITSVSAYISKNNPRSHRIAEELGLSVIKENASGTSFLYSGEIQHILRRYLK